MTRIPRCRPALLVLSALLLIALAWLAITDDVRIWPVRNTAQYRLLRWWWARAGTPESSAPGTLRGTVRDAQGQLIAGARVLVSRWDGTTYSAASGADGGYAIAGIPAGRYTPVAGAPGFDDAELASSLVKWPPLLAGATRQRVPVVAGRETLLDVALTATRTGAVAPGKDLRVGPASEIECQQPMASRAQRQEVTFKSAGRRNQLTLLYTPAEADTGTGQLAAALTTGNGDAEKSPSPQPSPRGRGSNSASALPSWPLLLTVYPGPADGWECASLPLAQVGYAVLAVGPAYSFEPERDVDEIERLLGFARAGQLPGVDGTRAAVLGGSYSALHVLRILEREGGGSGLRAALLLGPPADLFDMRRRYEDGTFIPPFGLDQALVALGLPDRAPLRYWRYSGAYHVRPDFPPVLLVHSRDDPVVPYQQSEQLAAALAAAGVPHDLRVFDAAGHYLLSETGEAEAIYRLSLDFLEPRLRR